MGAWTLDGEIWPHGDAEIGRVLLAPLEKTEGICAKGALEQLSGLHSL